MPVTPLVDSDVLHQQGAPKGDLLEGLRRVCGHDDVNDVLGLLGAEARAFKLELSLSRRPDSAAAHWESSPACGSDSSASSASEGLSATTIEAVPPGALKARGSEPWSAEDLRQPEDLQCARAIQECAREESLRGLPVPVLPTGVVAPAPGLFQELGIEYRFDPEWNKRVDWEGSEAVAVCGSAYNPEVDVLTASWVEGWDSWGAAACESSPSGCEELTPMSA